MSIENTLISHDVLRLTAGNIKKFNITVRTNERLRYSLNLSTSDIRIVELPSNTSVLNVTVKEGLMKNTFEVWVNST